MAKDFSLSIVAPDRSVVEDQAVSVVAPGALGYFGIMAGHVPMVAALSAGIVEYVDGKNQRHHVAVGGGFAEVSGERLTILADSAALATEINVKEEEERLERARRALRGEDSEMTSAEATQEIDRAMARIRAAKR
jgi:F-type H+-transporting ATPase subunit epsilon